MTDRARPTVIPVPVPLNHMEVAVHKAYRQYEMGPTSHHVSFDVAGGELRNKPVAGPVPDVDEENTSAGPVTDAEVKSNAETSNSATIPPYSVMDITDA